MSDRFFDLKQGRDDHMLIWVIRGRLLRVTTSAWAQKTIPSETSVKINLDQ